jgi:hypothetical protein
VAFGASWMPAPTLGDRRRLLVDAHVDAGPQQRQRRRQTTDPAADHGGRQRHPAPPLGIIDDTVQLRLSAICPIPLRSVRIRRST